jgi:hypothetical protein
MPVSPSRRWIVPIPLTNRLLCRSFKGEWYLFKDAWDIGRNLKEAIIALAATLLLMAVFLPEHSTPVVQLPQQQQFQTIERIAVLANEIGYPDALVRRRFTPYVCNNVLYLPLQDL